MMDLHCHLDLYPNALELLPLVATRNKFTLAVTTSPRAWRATSRLFKQYSTIEVALGLHPEIVKEKRNEIDLLLSSISNVAFIGEVGIDGSRHHKQTIELQRELLEAVLIESERAGGRILSVHSRGAATAVLDLIERHCRKSTVILHWFSGSPRELQRALSLDCRFSVGPAMLSSAKGLSLVSKLPIEMTLPETDGPFARKGSIPLMPWEAIKIVDIIAPIWKQTKAAMCLQFEQNLSLLLSKNVRGPEF